ncbi:hypothetical protein predicted by Glimmer [Lactococcus cremoris subsp. cremoris MG1363]|uniref:Uncharacterized protein n=1 Tax=Lactococcus lactis subsp. cremoris (strain MG1363) TaxID=416870 RepID=A2RKK8_LACLM|nr:hypothetical protein predicted by Glimmer [Lactococcus cremoris subsp. cremoris MG1363]
MTQTIIIPAVSPIIRKEGPKSFLLNNKANHMKKIQENMLLKIFSFLKRILIIKYYL